MRNLKKEPVPDSERREPSRPLDRGGKGGSPLGLSSVRSKTNGSTTGNDPHNHAHSLMFSGFSSPASNLNPCNGLLSLRKFYSLVLLSRRNFIRFKCATILVLVSWVSVLSALVARQWENLTIYWLCIDKFLPFPIGQLTMLLQQVVLGFLNKKNGHRIIESCFKRFIINNYMINLRTQQES